MAIDYQVGDIVQPKSPRFSWVKARVIDINEKYILLEFLNGSLADSIENPVRIYITEAELLEKDKIGTLLYGDKSK